MSGWFVRLPVDVVRVRGADAGTFLQGQVSADVTSLAAGEVTRALLLEPQGRLVAWLRVACLTPGGEGGVPEYLCEVDAGFGERVLERLERFRIRVDAACTLSTDFELVAVRNATAALTAGATYRQTVVWAGVPGTDLVGFPVADPELAEDGELEAYEALRIEAGVPAMATELADRPIPEEAGVVDGSVSWTKGCYVGQELVARVDSRGAKVPRRLCVVHLSGAEVPAVGATLTPAVPATESREPVGAGGQAVAGVVTSAAYSARLGHAVALAYVARSADCSSGVWVNWEGHRVPATVHRAPEPQTP